MQELLENLKARAKNIKGWEPHIVFVFLENEDGRGGWRTTRPIRIWPDDIQIDRYSGTDYTAVHRPNTVQMIAGGVLVGMFLAREDFPQMNISL